MTNLTNIVTFVSLGEGTEGGGRQQRCQRLGRSVFGQSNRIQYGARRTHSACRLTPFRPSGALLSPALPPPPSSPPLRRSEIHTSPGLAQESLAQLSKSRLDGLFMLSSNQDLPLWDWDSLAPTSEPIITVFLFGIGIAASTSEPIQFIWDSCAAGDFPSGIS